MFILSYIPICISIFMLSLLSSIVSYLCCMQQCLMYLILINLILLLYCLFIWLYNLIVEFLYIGLDTTQTQYFYIKSFYLFIFIEIMFFFSFFWIYFSISLNSNIVSGFNWFPIYMNHIIIWHTDTIAIMNILLISSSLLFTILYSIKNILQSSNNLLKLIILFGISFNYMQWNEYIIAPISISNGVIASTLYAITGLHGIHVLIGIILLIVIIYRIYYYYFTIEHPITLIISIYYWNFVDVIWFVV